MARKMTSFSIELPAYIAGGIQKKTSSVNYKTKYKGKYIKILAYYLNEGTSMGFDYVPYVKSGAPTPVIKNIKLCKKGYHFTNIERIHSWFDRNDQRLFVVEVLNNAKIIHDTDKSVASSIKFISEIPRDVVEQIWMDGGGDEDYEPVQITAKDITIHYRAILANLSYLGAFLDGEEREYVKFMLTAAIAGKDFVRFIGTNICSYITQFVCNPDEFEYECNNLDDEKDFLKSYVKSLDRIGKARGVAIKRNSTF